MTTGLTMLMKSFGLDPEEMKKQISSYGELVLDLHSRMVRMEANQNEIIGWINQQRDNDNGRTALARRDGDTGAVGADSAVPLPAMFFAITSAKLA